MTAKKNTNPHTVLLSGPYGGSPFTDRLHG
nr:MAG TPA: hypothetical protein [Caudoviricetes sp.]